MTRDRHRKHARLFYGPHYYETTQATRFGGGRSRLFGVHLLNSEFKHREGGETVAIEMLRGSDDVPSIL